MGAVSPSQYHRVGPKSGSTNRLKTLCLRAYGPILGAEDTPPVGLVSGDCREDRTAHPIRPTQGVAVVKSPPIAALAIASLFMLSAPAAFAQGTHSNASSSGTTGTFTVPLAAVLGAGEFHVGAF